MAKPGREELRKAAFEALRALGYRPTLGRLEGYYGRSVQRMVKDGVESWYLIQCRHYQSSTYRYLVGINVDALDRVDQVVLFFQGESKILIFPADYLRQIHRQRIKAGDARFSGEHKNQWRINVHLDDEQLSSQGFGARHDISAFVNEVPADVLV